MFLQDIMYDMNGHTFLLQGGYTDRHMGRAGSIPSKVMQYIYMRSSMLKSSRMGFNTSHVKGEVKIELKNVEDKGPHNAAFFCLVYFF